MINQPTRWERTRTWGGFIAHDKPAISVMADPDLKDPKGLIQRAIARGDISLKPVTPVEEKFIAHRLKSKTPNVRKVEFHPRPSQKLWINRSTSQETISILIARLRERYQGPELNRRLKDLRKRIRRAGLDTQQLPPISRGTTSAASPPQTPSTPTPQPRRDQRSSLTS